jgi:hypothetical protein
MSGGHASPGATRIAWAQTAWLETTWRWLGLLAVLLTTFVLVRLAVLNIFYTTGDLRDPSWLASVIWHNDWRLHGPAAFPAPYFSEHVSPILWLANAVSYVVPLSRYDLYAAWIAIIHALYAAGVYRAWRLSDDRLTAPRALVAVLVALAATFSGVAVAALRLPHPELAIPALALWFCIAMAERTYGWAGFWLALCLAIREDAGLHVFMLLAPWACVLAARHRRVTPDVKWLLGFAAAAAVYSVAVFIAKRLEFPGADTMTRSYLGDPPFHHLTLSLLKERLDYYLRERTYVLLPMAATFVWAAMSRNPLLPLGYLAALPWLGFNFVAIHPTPGTLSYYYAFPFWLSLGWPLVALYAWRNPGGRTNRRWPYTLLLLFSVTGWHDGRWVIYPAERDGFGQSPFAYNDTLRDRERYQAFFDYFQANRALFGLTALDQAVFGLMIDKTDRSAWIDPWRHDEPPTTMIVFPHAFDWRTRVVPLLRSGLYACIYEVPGTHIELATQNELGGRLPAPVPMLLVTSSLGARC